MFERFDASRGGAGGAVSSPETIYGGRLTRPSRQHTIGARSNDLTRRQEGEGGPSSHRLKSPNGGESQAAQSGRRADRRAGRDAARPERPPTLRQNYHTTQPRKSIAAAGAQCLGSCLASPPRGTHHRGRGHCCRLLYSTEGYVNLVTNANEVHDSKISRPERSCLALSLGIFAMEICKRKSEDSNRTFCPCRLNTKKQSPTVQFRSLALCTGP